MEPGFGGACSLWHFWDLEGFFSPSMGTENHGTVWVGRTHEQGDLPVSQVVPAWKWIQG